MARSGGGAEEQARRSVVPKPIQTAAGTSLWPAAVWTGLGAAIVCATLAIVVVAACWLPVSGTTGRTNSAIRAGLLTFLAALHGGITVDGVSAAWLPLGMLVIVAVMARPDPARLVVAGLAQVLSFTVGALVAVPFATLGTSRAPFLGVGVGAMVVFGASGGVAFVRSSALRDWVGRRIPGPLATVLRAGGSAAAVYLGCGGALAAVSLVLHHAQAEQLSTSVGAGIGGIPVLVLGVLAAPNVAICAAAYLAGPGFALGTGTHVSLFGAAHGTLPAFPVLAAVPSGAPNPAAWGLAAVAPVLAGIVVARVAVRADGWWRRFGVAAGAALAAGVAMLVLGWQGGGSVGDGRLRAVGASPWQLGGAVAAAVAVIASLALVLVAAWRALRRRREDDDADSFFETLRFPRLAAVSSAVTKSEDDHDEAADRAG